jgi:predicted nucleotidyltransferase
MISKKQALIRLQGFKETNGSKYGIISLGVFGSLARNQATENSDVDVVVETLNTDAFQMVHLKDELKDLLNAEIDIVRKRPTMNPFLKKRIEQDAVYV